MEIHRRSIRAKLTLLLLLVGVGPLMLGSLYSYSSTRAGLLEVAQTDMETHTREIDHALGMLFSQARTDLLLAAANPAFQRHLTDPQDRAYWLAQQEKALLFFDRLFPGLLDEACFITTSGAEVSRMVSGKIERGEKLSTQENRYDFFSQALTLRPGKVFQGKPTVSPDTHRWVIPNATRITFSDGRAAGVLHFEVSLNGVRRILRQFDPPGAGYLVLMDNRGRVLTDTAPSGSLVKATTALYAATAENRRLPTTRGRLLYLARGDDGYYLSFKEMTRSPDNENLWSLGYALPYERVFAQATALSYVVVLLGGTLGAVLLSWGVGRRFTRPIHHLREGVRRVRLGNLDSQLDLRTGDELEEVAREFNAMAQELKSLYDGLEDKIERRTRDLTRTQKKLRELLKKVINAQEEERKRLARELHDETSQALSALILTLEMIEREMAEGRQAKARAHLHSVKELVDRTLDSLQLLVHNLRPSLLDDLGIMAALRSYASQYQAHTGIDVRLEAGMEERLPPEIESTLYRIIQESLTNVARHSGARSATVKLACDRRACRLAVEDDGRGFEQTEVNTAKEGGRGGFGLLGIRERVSLLGGTMTVDSGPGRGTSLRVELPLSREEAANG